MTPFENAIKEYLDERAKEDVKFAEKYSNEKKSIEECCRFILGEMREKAKSGMYGATDAEVFGLAVHYYDEEDIKVEKNVSAEVVINREMTEEEKQQLDKRKEAEKKTVNDFYCEGNALHHCVFAMGYYKRKECLILGAKVNGERTETIEVSLKDFSVVQCRGKNNMDSPYHKRIMSLMSSNLGSLKDRYRKVQ